MLENKKRNLEEHQYNLTHSTEIENRPKLTQKELDEINNGVIERLYVKEVEKTLEKNHVKQLHYQKNSKSRFSNNEHIESNDGRERKDKENRDNRLNSDFSSQSQNMLSTDNKVNISDIEEVTK